MKELWRIPLTVALLFIIAISPTPLIVTIPNPILPFLWLAWMAVAWLICGFLMVAICVPDISFRVACKLVSLWLFAIWSGRIRDWVMKE